jgi:rRNA-processing protein FCF1
MLIVVPDTNLFLQCKAIDELSWIDLFPSVDEIAIIIPRVVISELDRLKNDGNLRRAKRSRASVSRFAEMLEKMDQPFVIRKSNPKVSMRFAPRTRLLPEQFPDLDLSRPDDRFVAEAQNLAIKHVEVVIVTGDIGLELMAREMNLRVQRLPDNWRLPPEPDPTERELLRLKQAAQKEPNLKVSFLNQSGTKVSEIFEHSLLRPTPLDSATRSRVISEIKANNPLSSIVSQLSNPMTPLRTINLLGVSTDQTERYADKYRRWCGELDKWVDELPQLIHLRSRAFGLKIHIHNSGSGPADELRLDLQLSLGFSFAKRNILDFKVSPPPPPEAPRSAFDYVRPQIIMPTLARQLARFREERDPFEFYYRVAPEEGVCSPTISLTCDSLHHESSATVLTAITVDENVNSGAMSLSLSARNIKAPLSVKLPLRIVEREIEVEEKDEYLMLLLNTGALEA